MAKLDTDWSTAAIVARREKYYAASQRAFVPYKYAAHLSPRRPPVPVGRNWPKYLDLLGMNVCVSVGHNHPTVTAAVREQMEQLQHCTTMFYHPVPAHFAEELAARMPKGHDWVVHFTNSGTEAIDLALVMAQQFTGNIDMLALRNAYHGATIGAQSLTGISGFRHNIPLLGGIHHVANPDPYRGIFGDDTRGLPRRDRPHHPVRHLGQTRGLHRRTDPGLWRRCRDCLPGYLAAAAAKVRARGGMMIVDEVQSGFGRTGDNFWGFEAHGVVPEIVVMAKGIGNGFPLGAVVAQRHVADALAGKFSFHTYGASPISCAAGRAVLQVIDEEGLQANSQKRRRPAAAGAATGCTRSTRSSAKCAATA